MCAWLFYSQSRPASVRQILLLLLRGARGAALPAGSTVLTATYLWCATLCRVGLVLVGRVLLLSRYERYWDATKWIWVSHGHSNAPMRPSRPVALDNRHIFFLQDDGLLTERFWNGIGWVWFTHQVPQAGEDIDPEAEQVAFCSPEIGVHNSCAPPLLNAV